MNTVVIESIDFDLLKAQKMALLSIEESQLTEAQNIAVQGMICLCDAIQDYAVDVLGMDKNVVFNLSKDDDGEAGTN